MAPSKQESGGWQPSFRGAMKGNRGSLRRAGTALFAMLLCWPQGAVAQPGATRVQVASALWSLPSHGRASYPYSYVIVRRLLDDPSTLTARTTVYLAAGTCHDDPDGDRYCKPSTERTVEVGSDSFSMSADAATASLELRLAGKRQIVRWVAAASEPGQYIAPSFCPSGDLAALGAGLQRSALAQGRVLGRRLQPRWSQGDGVLESGMELNPCM